MLGSGGKLTINFRNVAKCKTVWALFTNDSTFYSGALIVELNQ